MSEYWESRKIDKIFDQNTDDVIDTLKKIYRRQGREIQKAITDIYIKMLQDGGISTIELYKFNRFNDLLNEINSILKSYGEQEIKAVSKGLEQATRDIIGDISKNSNLSFNLINEKVIQEIVNTKFKGESFSKRIWKNRDALGKLIEKNLQDIVASGMNKDKAVKQIMDIHNSSFNNADRLVRTETMRCINSGQIETYKARGRTHGYYSYSKDKRTCDKCKKLGEDTKKNPLPLEELEPVHHPNCRCTVIPVVDFKKYEKYDSINIDNVSNFKDLKTYFKNNYNVSVSDEISKLDFKAVKQSSKGIDYVLKEFPQAKSIFKGLDIKNSGVMCATYNGTINFNPLYYKDYNTLKENMEQGDTTGFHPKNTGIIECGSHEMGHILERALIEKVYIAENDKILAWSKCEQAKILVSNACKNVKKLKEGKGLKNNQLISQISMYAEQDKSECLAEAVADYIANKENASILSKEIWKLLKEELG